MISKIKEFKILKEAEENNTTQTNNSSSTDDISTSTGARVSFVIVLEKNVEKAQNQENNSETENQSTENNQETKGTEENKEQNTETNESIKNSLFKKYYLKESDEEQNQEIKNKDNNDQENNNNQDIKSEIINIVNDIVNNINNSKGTAIINQAFNNKNVTFTGNAEQSGRYNLKVKASFDQKSIKYNQSKDGNTVQAVFTINLSVVSKDKLKRDIAMKVASGVGNVAGTVLKGTTATNTSALGGAKA